MRKKEPIKLRSRLLKDGSRSLYLDIYMDGSRSYEYLKLYLIPESGRQDKIKNQETMRLAQAIQAQRIVDLQSGRHGFDRGYKWNMDFLEYFLQSASKRKANIGSYDTWRGCYRQLQNYARGKITMRQVTPEWLTAFVKYLEAQDLKNNTINIYMTKITACLHEAVKDKIIPNNPCDYVEKPRMEQGERVYLTIEEVQKLWDTPCEKPELKRAFLFSCLTGLRKSDVQKLTWAEIHTQGGYTRIIFRQKKTRSQEYLDITDQAAMLLGDRGEPHERVFSGFMYDNTTTLRLQQWAHSAGIDKEITYHSSRHTFAIMMLDLDVDIYTVSKLLGHKSLETTQIYAHILDRRKQAAVSKIPKFTK